MKIALYDFCDTVVNFQTADEYVYFTQKYLDLKEFRHTFMDHEKIRELFIDDWKTNKGAILYQLRRIRRSALEDAAKQFYTEKILPNIYEPIVAGMKSHREDGYDIYIVSAGYNIYLDFFAEDFGVKGVVANDFLYQDDLFTGKLCRDDCYGEEKVRRLDGLFGKCSIEHSISYSDSISDLPLLKWTDKGVVVSRNVRRPWVKENGLEDFVLAEWARKQEG